MEEVLTLIYQNKIINYQNKKLYLYLEKYVKDSNQCKKIKLFIEI